MRMEEVSGVSMDIDMRGRLDSKGNRLGKMVPYKFSDLRMTEILEGLCEKMNGYVPANTSDYRPTLNKSSTSLLPQLGMLRAFMGEANVAQLERQVKEQQKLWSKPFVDYCNDLVDRDETFLTRLIRKQVSDLQFEVKLCVRKLQDCSRQELKYFRAHPAMSDDDLKKMQEEKEKNRIEGSHAEDAIDVPTERDEATETDGDGEDGGASRQAPSPSPAPAPSPLHAEL